MRSVAVVLALVAAGCGSSSRVATGPTPVKCQVALASSATTLTATGGTLTVQVTTTPECTWTAAAEANWIAASGPTSGQGNGEVPFQIPANPTPAMRQGDILVNDARLRVQQEAALCQFAVAPPRQAAAADGGGGEFAVTTAAGCAWSALSESPWITIAGAGSGNGSGAARYTAAPNTGPARSGRLIIAGQAVLVDQADGTPLPPQCTYVLSTTSQSVPAGGGGGAVGVVAGPACPWTAVSSDAWLSVTSGDIGSGNGTVGFNVAPNPGDPRSGILTIARQTFTVTQAGTGPCAYAINPTTQSMGASGGNGGPVSVATDAACAWAAASHVPWITITSGASGVGPGSVAFDVAANSGGARSGTLSIAGTVFTLTQAGAPGCTYAINPNSQSMGAGGGSGTPVSVSTDAACSWSAVSNVPWITVTGSGSGIGPGSVGFTVAVNTGGARTGTLTIAGQTFTLSQAAPPACAYAINPSSASIGAVGGSGPPVAVSGGAGCSWTAVSSVPWILVTSGASGTGPGTVTFTVAPNAGPARTGLLTIAGENFLVSQSALSACSYSVNPTSESLGWAGGPGSPITVSTASNCAWTAVSNDSWLTIPANPPRSGNGVVLYTAAPNTGAARVGTLTIAGQTVTVSQAAAVACSYTIAPSSESFGLGGGPGTPIAVTAPAGCAWTAVSDVAWVTITGGASGSGTGVVLYRVAANLVTRRTGTMTIAGQTFTVTQTGLLVARHARPIPERERTL